MTALEHAEALKVAWDAVVSAEAYLLDADPGPDRRNATIHLNRKRRAFLALKAQEADGIPATTGAAGVLAGARLYDEAAARRDEDRAGAEAVWQDKQEARA